MVRDSKIYIISGRNIRKIILKSDSFEDIEFEDLIGEYTFDKMLKNVGLTTNRRK